MSSTFYHCDEFTFDGQHIREYARATSQEQETVLQLSVKRYTPLDNPCPESGDITIIAAQALGWPKEMYETLWDELYLYAKRTSGFRIRSIWIADPSNLGLSGVLNENKLGDEPCWHDHARDLLHMTNHFRAEMPRPLVGIGHSMGGTSILNLAILHPRLLSTLIVIEPIVQRTPPLGMYMDIGTPAAISTFKKDIWPSREVAAKAFRRNKFYQSWDPRVLELWIKYGLRDTPTPLYPDTPHTTQQQMDKSPRVGYSANTNIKPKLHETPAHPVTLTTTKHQEVFTYLRPSYPPRDLPMSSYVPNLLDHPGLGPDNRNVNSPFYRPETYLIFSQLPLLRPSCLYINGANSPQVSAARRAEFLAMTGVGNWGSGGAEVGAVNDAVMPKTGHFPPFEKPTLVAEHVGGWLDKEAVKWKRGAESHAAWTSRSQVAKTIMDEDFRYWVKEWFDRGSGPVPEDKSAGSKL